jgi:hypothetical protein
VSDDIAIARAAIQAVPLLAGRGNNVVRLGGLTNLVFKVGGYCLRVPGQGTEEYINRAPRTSRRHGGCASRCQPRSAAF